MSKQPMYPHVPKGKKSGPAESESKRESQVRKSATLTDAQWDVVMEALRDAKKMTREPTRSELDDIHYELGHQLGEW